MLKRDSNTSVSCEYCKIFENAYFEEHLGTAASVLHKASRKYWASLLNQKHDMDGFY